MNGQTFSQNSRKQEKSYCHYVCIVFSTCLTFSKWTSLSQKQKQKAPGADLSPTCRSHQNKNIKPRIPFLKCRVDFIFNLKSDLREYRLAGLAVENTVKCHSWTERLPASSLVWSRGRRELASSVPNIKGRCEQHGWELGLWHVVVSNQSHYLPLTKLSLKNGI